VTPKRTTAAETAKVTASTASAPPGPSHATISPPSANPSTCAVWVTIENTAVPTTNRSPASTCGSSAARAAPHGELSICTHTSRPATSGSDIPGTAIAATSTTRARSAHTITRRRGNRSAKPDSSGPPSRSGRNVNA